MSVILLALGHTTALCADQPLLHDGSLADSNIRFVGRWDRHVAAADSNWGGAYLRVGFTGTKIAASLDGESSIVVIIDNQPARYLNGHGIVALNALPLPAGNHTLLLGSSGQNSEVHMRGLQLESDATTLSVPARKLIEFVGDSITATPGKDGTNVTNYAWMTAEALDCDHVQIAFSGIALTTGLGFFGDKTGFDQYYFHLQNPNHEKPQPWDFSYKPDRVVINLGTNDVRNGVRPDTDEFASSYGKFLHSIRAKLPEADLVAIRPFGGFEEKAIRKAVRQMNADGDKRVKYIDTSGWLSKDDFSDGIHPTVAGHAKAAVLLAKVLLAPAAPVVEPHHPAELFQSHMVLQQGVQLPVWGHESR